MCSSPIIVSPQLDSLQYTDVFLYWNVQNWTQHSKWSLTNARWKGIMPSLHVLAALSQPKMLFAFIIVRARCCCIFNLSTKINSLFIESSSQTAGVELRFATRYWVTLTSIPKYPRTSCSGLQFSVTTALTKLARLCPTMRIKVETPSSPPFSKLWY